MSLAASDVCLRPPTYLLRTQVRGYLRAGSRYGMTPDFETTRLFFHTAKDSAGARRCLSTSPTPPGPTCSGALSHAKLSWTSSLTIWRWRQARESGMCAIVCVLLLSPD